jgi:FkbM family methyltransferase
VAIDVGANVGYFSALMASRVGRTGKVCALDPASAVWPQLEALQRESGGIVCARQLAVVGPGEAPEMQARFYVDPANPSWSTTVSSFAARGVQPVLVPAVSLDRFVEEEKIARLDFVKIDVEGAELAVLRGLQIVARRGMRPVVLCEFRFEPEGDAGAKAEPLLELAGACGYALMRLGAGGRRQPAPEEWIRRQRGVVNLVLYPAERLD